jgi:hypothetical protein
MTALQIDTDAARQAARTWAAWADRINDAQMRVGGDIEPLVLAQAATACARMTAAATELWTVSGFVTLLAEQLEAFDGGVPLLRESALDELMWLAGGRRGPVAGCPALSYSGVDGDRGGTFGADVRSPYDLAAGDPAELGRQLVMRALQDTGAPGQIRKDEFELVRLSDGRYLIALPGVIDLTHFQGGRDGKSNSVRDLDQSALRSSLDTSVGGNAYAQMVWESLLAQGVPAGSQLLIVGHSFGADTALDLAADSAFNGPEGFRVTHVVAAAYDSEPQLNDIPEGTKVLALQNRDDVPVLAEAAEHLYTQPIEDGREIVESVGDFDVRGVAGGVLGAAWHVAEAASPASKLVTHVDDVVGELRDGDLGDAAQDAVLPIPGVERRGEDQVDVVFDGGFDDFGHHQDRYVDYLASTSDPLVIGFLGSIGASAAVSGTAVAVDVSVPGKSRWGAQKT